MYVFKHTKTVHQLPYVYKHLHLVLALGSVTNCFQFYQIPTETRRDNEPNA